MILRETISDRERPGFSEAIVKVVGGPGQAWYQARSWREIIDVDVCNLAWSIIHHSSTAEALLRLVLVVGYWRSCRTCEDASARRYCEVTTRILKQVVTQVLAGD